MGSPRSSLAVASEPRDETPCSPPDAWRIGSAQQMTAIDMAVRKMVRIKLLRR
jgi:hypothetical protein